MIAFTINRAGCPPVQEGVRTGVRWLASQTLADTLACHLVFLVSGALLLKLPRICRCFQSSLAQACTRLPATAAGCNGMLPASDSLSAARWADAGAPFRARGPRSLEIVDCEQLAKRQRVDKLIKVAQIQRTFAWPCARLTRRCWQMERVAARWRSLCSTSPPRPTYPPPPPSHRARAPPPHLAYANQEFKKTLRKDGCSRF